MGKLKKDKLGFVLFFLNYCIDEKSICLFVFKKVKM